MGTTANVNGLDAAGQLLHGDEHAAFGDAGCQGVHKRREAAGPTWHVAMRPGERKKLNPFIKPDFIVERVEKMRASIRVKVEHRSSVLKRQSGFTEVRYGGLAKNTAQLTTLFALSSCGAAERPSQPETTLRVPHLRFVSITCAICIVRRADRAAAALKSACAGPGAATEIEHRLAEVTSLLDPLLEERAGAS